jgi:hypothetical protein
MKCRDSGKGESEMGDIVRNFRTSILGLLILVAAGQVIVQDPDVLLDRHRGSELIASVLAGVGLLLAKDGNKMGTASVEELVRKREEERKSEPGS